MQTPSTDASPSTPSTDANTKRACSLDRSEPDVSDLSAFLRSMKARNSSVLDELFFLTRRDVCHSSSSDNPDPTFNIAVDPSPDLSRTGTRESEVVDSARSLDDAELDLLRQFQSCSSPTPETKFSSPTRGILLSLESYRSVDELFFPGSSAQGLRLPDRSETFVLHSRSELGERVVVELWEDSVSENTERLCVIIDSAATGILVGLSKWKNRSLLQKLVSGLCDYLEDSGL